MQQLHRLIILHESEAACLARLRAAGMPEETAAEVAFYLAQATDFAACLEQVTAAFAASGIVVDFLPLDEIDRWLPLLREAATQPVMLWSLTDGFHLYRGSFTSSVAALLKLTTFGSPPEAQHLAQDKFRCLALAAALGIRTPPTILVEDGRPLSPIDVLPAVGQELFVKPNRLGGKLGIEADSRTLSLDQALDLTRRIHARYGDQALIQPYLPGRDVRVSYMNLGRSEAPIGIYAINEGGDRGFLTLADSRRVTKLAAADGKLSVLNLRDEPAVADAVREIEDAARTLARVVPLRDYFSMDFRLGEDGEAWFLELEVCPAVTIYDFLTYLRDVYGTDLAGALAAAVPAAFARATGSG